MKKIFLLLLVIVVLCLAAVYILIPGRIKISIRTVAACIPKNIADCLRNGTEWNRWLPGNTGNYQYKLTQAFTDGGDMEVSDGNKKYDTRILVIPLGKDSSAVEWQGYFQTSFDPFKRVIRRVQAGNLERSMHDLLDNLITYASKTENVYGFPIERTTFTDTTLLATKFSTLTYPSNEIIYAAIDRLKKRISDEGVIEKDFPMLNVRQIDSSHFETMIAICIDREIHNEANIFISRMVPMKDRFLKTEVTGGPLMIKEAHEAIENYMNDHLLTQPAIPFEILVTDRRKEADTSKWKTTIFYPSM